MDDKDKNQVYEPEEEKDNKTVLAEDWSPAHNFKIVRILLNDIIIALVLSVLLFKIIFNVSIVSGTSMNPTLHDGNLLLLNHLFYEPEYNDIVVFENEERGLLVKRIIGMPGEKVRIDDAGNIYINGEILKESYGREIILDPGIAKDEIILGEDEYFVLGDNRNNSSDSRDPSVGIIHKEDIIGRAWLRIYPFDDFGFIKHQ